MPTEKCVSTRLRKLRAMFVLTFLLNAWGVEPNDVVLSVPALFTCVLWHVFKLVAEVAMS